MAGQRTASVRCMPKDFPRFKALGFVWMDDDGPLRILHRDDDGDVIASLVLLAKGGLEFFGAWTHDGPFPAERFCAAGGTFRCVGADENLAPFVRVNEDGTVNAGDLAYVADYLDFEHVVEARMKRAAALTEKEQR